MDPGNLPARKTPRLKGFDYSAGGAYFVTFCTHAKRHALAEIRRGDPCGRPSYRLTALGTLVEQTILQLSDYLPCRVEKYVIMPNHVHLIIFLTPGQRATARVAPTLGRVIGALKSLAARRWLQRCNEAGHQMGQIWQRGYYDHVIRDEHDFQRAWRYIDENPARWAQDKSFLLKDEREGDPPWLS